MESNCNLFPEIALGKISKTIPYKIIKKKNQTGKTNNDFAQPFIKYVLNDNYNI